MKNVFGVLFLSMFLAACQTAVTTEPVVESAAVPVTESMPADESGEAMEKEETMVLEDEDDDTTDLFGIEQELE